jgi:hypothetical protein
MYKACSSTIPHTRAHLIPTTIYTFMNHVRKSCGEQQQEEEGR